VGDDGVGEAEELGGVEPEGIGVVLELGEDGGVPEAELVVVVLGGEGGAEPEHTEAKVGSQEAVFTQFTIALQQLGSVN